MLGATRFDAMRSGERLDIHSLLPVVTGMPELCRAGLSETWLLKACGHRHWLTLAEAHGLVSPEFRDAGGARLYPAFTGLQVCEARLETVGENRVISFDVSLTRASRTRFRSTIRVNCDGDPIAEVTMETVFVRRAVEGANTSASRAVVAGPCLLIPQGLGRLAAAENAPYDSRPLASLLLDPSPYEDFNGAGFLYFAAFQAMADRAEWSWSRGHGSVPVARRREIVFLANAELGERIRATLLAEARSIQGYCRTIHLARESDGSSIGHVRVWRDLRG